MEPTAGQVLSYPFVVCMTLYQIEIGLGRLVFLSAIILSSNSKQNSQIGFAQL